MLSNFRGRDKSKHGHYRKKSKSDKLDKYKDSLSEGLQIDVSDSEEELVINLNIRIYYWF